MFKPFKPCCSAAYKWKISAYGWILSFFFLFCDNKESKMGYLKRKQARKSAVGAWFSQCLAQENVWTMLPSCLEHPRKIACPGWQDQGGFGMNGSSNIVSHQRNQTLFRMIPPLSLCLWEKRFSSTLHFGAEGSKSLLRKAQNHKNKGRAFRANAEPLCNDTLSTTHLMAVQPCQEWSGEDTALTHSLCPGHWKQSVSALPQISLA